MIAAVISFALLTCAAPADPMIVEEAKALFEIGADAYEKANYSLAVDAFAQAYARAPRPAVAFSLAQAYRMQYSIDSDPGNLQRAAELYQKYVEEVKHGGRREDAARHLFNVRLLLVREHGISGAAAARLTAPMKPKTQVAISSRIKDAKGSIDGGNYSELPFSAEVSPGTHKIRVEAPGYFPEEFEPLAVEGSLVAVPVNLRAMPGMINVRATSGAEISIDGRPVGEAPLEQKLAIEAGDHFVAITKRGTHAYTRELTLGRGQAVDLDVELDTTDQRHFAQAALVGAAALAAGGAITAGFSFAADGRAAELDDMQHEVGYLKVDEAQRLNRSLKQRDEYRLASEILFGTSVVVGVTGALLYLFDSPHIDAQPRKSESEPAVVPLIGPDTVGASVNGTF